MMQLSPSPSPSPDVTPPPECSEEGEERQEDPVTAGSPKVGSPGGLSALQLSLEASTAYHDYETYIEDGLICLKHKVRNLEKKKLELEDYKKRLNQGEALNKDQMTAVEKYEEVLHNLAFAQELQKTLDGLTQNLLRAQRKTVKKEQVAKVEVERRHLSTVLQVQHLLRSLQQEHVRRDLLAGHNQAPHVPAQQLHSLRQLAALLGVERNNRLGLEEQMEQAALAYLDLLEGKDKPVAGSTFKLLKEELTRLLNCKYFSCLPPPPNKSPEFLTSTSHSTHTDLRSPVDVLPIAMHSTPLPTGLMGRKASLTNGDECLETCDLELSSKDLPHVFKGSASLPQNGELNYKPDSAVFAEPRYSTASTQTPPEFAPSEDEPQPVYQSDYTVGNGGQIFLSPGQSSGSVGRPGQSYYTRGSVRGGFYSPQAHFRDSGPLLYASRDSGDQHSYRRGGGRHNSSAWNDSSQVSGPNLHATFTIVDSGRGDSLSFATFEIPLTPHHHSTLFPMQLYPPSQLLRVAFSATRTANFAPGNLDQPIVFDHLHFNLGEMYNTRTGCFTCPINGTYVFIFHILKLAINVPLYINLMLNEEVMVSAYANDGAPDHETASNNAILSLFQGDQVWLRLHRGAIYGSTWNYSAFSGFLLHQD